MDILDVCDPTPDGYRYILVIADYFSKWTEAFPIKDKCADTVADVLVSKIILRFGMPLVIHSDQGREFENGLMKSLCNLLGCVKTRTAPYHPESDGMVKRFNRTCLMMLSMFVNDRRDNWNELLPFVMHAYRTSVHESTGYSPFRLMMGEVGAALLPSDGPKEIGISLDRSPASRTQGYRPYSGHSKGTGGLRRLYSCRRFENMSTTQSFRMDPGTVDSKVAVRQHSGFPSGLSH